MKADKKKGILDVYDSNARLKPALLVNLPVILTSAYLGRGWSGAVSFVSGLLVSVGVTFLLAELGRDWGKRKGPYLFSLWGGKPSTAKLRHRDGSVNPHTLATYHDAASHIIGRPLPTLNEEKADPHAADLTYEAVGDCLREKTRNKTKFPLIFKELVSNAFRRNLWGMKILGMSLTLICIILLLGILARQVHNGTFLAPTLLAALTNVALLLVWIFIVNPNWVRISADAYAERLLASSTAFEKTQPKKPAGKKAS